MAITHLYADSAKKIQKMDAVANGNKVSDSISNVLKTVGHLRIDSNTDAETTVSRLLQAGFKASVASQDYKDTTHRNIQIRAGEIIAYTR